MRRLKYGMGKLRCTSGRRQGNWGGHGHLFGEWESGGHGGVSDGLFETIDRLVTAG